MLRDSSKVIMCCSWPWKCKIKISREFCLVFTWKNYPVAGKFFSIYLFNASWLIEGHHVLLMAMKMQNKKFARVLPCFYLKKLPRGPWLGNFSQSTFLMLRDSSKVIMCCSWPWKCKRKISREFCLVFTWTNYPVARNFFSIYLFNASWLIEGHHVLLMAMKMQNKNFARVLPCFYLKKLPRGWEIFLNLPF